MVSTFLLSQVWEHTFLKACLLKQGNFWGPWVAEASGSAKGLMSLVHRVLTKQPILQISTWRLQEPGCPEVPNYPTIQSSTCLPDPKTFINTSQDHNQSWCVFITGNLRASHLQCPSLCPTRSGLREPRGCI